MNTRRTFLAAVAALPFLGWLEPVEADDALRIDTAGRVGIGVTPSTEANIVGPFADMRDCILIGSGADAGKLRTRSGEILFATPTESLLISDGRIFLNGVEQSTVRVHGAMVMLEAMRDSLILSRRSDY
mgnify:CR=1 FL=1